MQTYGATDMEHFQLDIGNGHVVDYLIVSITSDKYVHKGISGRKFVKSFRLSEYAEVNGADLTDGILTVSIEVVLPEKMRPQQISIGTGRQTNDNNSAQLLNESA